MRARLSIRTLLLGAHAFVWLIPVFALFGMRMLDVVLLRQTEHQLIAESIVIGEAYRTAWFGDGQPQEYRPPVRARYEPSDRRYVPITARIGFDDEILPPQTEPTRAGLTVARAKYAGERINAMLQRAQTFNLSAIRVLDANGCVVATTRGEEGLCMNDLPEVAEALSGRYASVLRARVSDEPPPPFGDIRRRGKVRVFTALPLFDNGKVIGVVRASRTGRDALSSLWDGRRWLVWLAGSTLLLLLVVSFGSAAAIARPLRRLTGLARAVAAGAPTETLSMSGAAPKEVAQLHEVLLGMAQRLEQRASYVRDFASQVSHELKTPITAIRGAAELLAHGESDMPPADRERFLQNILEDAQRMERLVSRLLTLAKLENASADNPAPIALEGVLKHLLERYGDRVRLTCEPALAPLAISEESLASVVLNLVENALRHGGHDVVRVQVAPDQTFTRIDVIDRGSGVSEANRRRLFERFFTTERDAGGTGLGLAIVRAIAEARGGRAFASFGSEGSTFTVML